MAQSKEELEKNNRIVKIRERLDAIRSELQTYVHEMTEVEKKSKMLTDEAVALVEEAKKLA